jgi:hypothetical protein
MGYARSGIATSMLLTAVGAILRYTVTASVDGVALRTVGPILMLSGFVGLGRLVAGRGTRTRRRARALLRIGAPVAGAC